MRHIRLIILTMPIDRRRWKGPSNIIRHRSTRIHGGISYRLSRFSLFLSPPSSIAPRSSLYFSRCASSDEKAAKGSDAVGGGRAFGELNYLKLVQEQASFMSGATQCPALCLSDTRVACARSRTRRGRVARHECANNEGKFVPRSH